MQITGCGADVQILSRGAGQVQQVRRGAGVQSCGLRCKGGFE